MDVQSNNICILDTETTGLGKQAHRKDAIVEIGALFVSDGEVKYSFNSLCNPGDEYFLNSRADEALYKNGISVSDIKTAPPIQTVARKFRLLLKRFSPIAVYSYNVQFEQSFLCDPPWSFNDIDGLEWGPCIMLYTAEWLGEQGKNEWNDYYDNWRWPKQVDAAKTLGINIQEDKAHSAFYDAKVAYEIAKKTNLL